MVAWRIMWREVHTVLYGFLADLVVAIHVAYVSFVVGGQLAIMAGIALRWQWIRNFWFRLAHLLAIMLVATESIADVECPLTVWERSLRLAAGQEVTGDTFIGRLLHALIFYDFKPWVFTVTYITFAFIVLGTFVLAPPRWRGLRLPK